LSTKQNENSGKADQSRSNSDEAVPKGYRLKPDTHHLVEKLTKKINGTKDEVISRACRMFENSVNRSMKKKNFK
jgi:hypothetical protein